MPQAQRRRRRPAGGRRPVPARRPLRLQRRRLRGQDVADADEGAGRRRAGREQGRHVHRRPTSPRTAPSCRSALPPRLPGVKQLLLLVEKNPTTLAAMFDVTDAIEANFSTRVKMGQSSNVYAVA